MSWIKDLFIENSSLFLKLMNARWPRTEEIVNGIVKVLKENGIDSGRLLELCCGNGRYSCFMAKKGFKAVGVDISRAFIEDARNKAQELGVSDMVNFIEGDVRNLREILKVSEPFDVVINAWTSIGFFTQEEDLSIFKQAREVSRKGAILLIAESAHSVLISLKFSPTGYSELEDIVVLEKRKYNAINSQLNSTWIFYHKEGKDLKFISEVNYELHVYSLSELSNLLKKAGWETIAVYGDFSTLQPFSLLTGLNLVAKAV